LAIVKQAMQRMEGQVGVKSEFGAESRFWVELPQANAPVLSVGPALNNSPANGVGAYSGYASLHEKDSASWNAG
jgi:hypothetical protein